MNREVNEKVCRQEALRALGDSYRARGKTIVQCHGCFDIVHPGHIRYLQFSRQQGDILVVSLTGDDAIEKSDGTRPYMPQELRAESLAALEFVDHVVISESPTAVSVIEALRPDRYIKGKECENNFNPGFLAEKSAVEAVGGRVVFSSGDVVYSSTAILQDRGEAFESEGFGPASAIRLSTCCQRWGIDVDWMHRLLTRDIANLRVLVVGDVVCEQYVFCDTAGQSSEAPTLAVRQLQERHYVGGAGIVAAHLSGLGARVRLLSSVGRDRLTEQVLVSLDRAGVSRHVWRGRADIPVRRRYLVETQKIFNVEHGADQPLDSEVERELLDMVAELREEIDAVIFCDYGYGTVTQRFLCQALPLLRPVVSTVVGDIDSPRRSLLAMRDLDLLLPTERDLRSVTGDFESGLPSVALQLMRQSRLANLAVTLGKGGCVLFRPREESRADWFRTRLRCEFIPDLATTVVDTVASREAFLAAAALTLCARGSLNQAGYVGLAAAALAEGRVGSLALDVDELLEWSRFRSELRSFERGGARPRRVRPVTGLGVIEKPALERIEP